MGRTGNLNRNQNKKLPLLVRTKVIMARETILTYQQFDKPFIVYSDSIEKQMGGIVTQEGKPLGFFSKKLTNTQQ